jgi:uncharacterized phage protein (TIGR02218 family)
MREVDPDLLAELDGGATTLCRCWRVRRRDGLVLGFTDHDRTLVFEGTTFRAETGADAAMLQTGTGLSVDSSQAVGALSDAAINEDDLRAGRFDRAEVEHWLVDWRRPERRVLVFRGTLGEIRRTENAFEAELRGLTDTLNLPVGRTIARTCDRILGDVKCGVDLSKPAFSHSTIVASTTPDGRLELADGGNHADGWFAGGALHWTSGRNAGLQASIKLDRRAQGRRSVQLALAPVLPVRAGDGVRLTAGCDRRVATCRDKFSNLLNFRGFPHIPGEDWLLAYPKDGEAHDGSSMYRG